MRQLHDHGRRTRSAELNTVFVKSYGAKGLVNNMWYRLTPAEAPVSQRNPGTMNEKHSRLLQTGSCAPYLRRAVTL